MRVLAMLLMTLRGTPFFYMGDEIGRERVAISRGQGRNPFEKLVPATTVAGSRARTLGRTVRTAASPMAAMAAARC